MRLILLTVLLCGFVSVQAQDEPYAARPGAWFPPLPEPEQPTDPSAVQEAAARDAFLNRLVEAGCPWNYPSDGTAPWGQGYAAGDDVDERVRDGCLDRQIVRLTPQVADSLDTLYALLREMEEEVSDQFGLADGLVGGQTTWLAHTNTVCAYEVAWYFGGAGGNTAWLDCSAVALKARQTWVNGQITRARTELPGWREQPD